MKKAVAIPLLVLLIVLHPACRKSEPMGLTEYAAHLTKANPAADGPAVDELVLDSSRETVVPINKIGPWPQTDRVPVAVKFIDTGNRYGINRLRVVYIVSIRPF
ncbi:MAG TPA: hypothetical protein VHE54_19050 [Puia sp.]|nr:hypothetical protein [Puia sp.]